MNKIDEINSHLGCIDQGSDLIVEGKRLITCGKGGIEYWDTSSCKLTHKSTEIREITTMTLLPNNLIAVAGRGNIIYILDENADIYKKISIYEEENEYIVMLDILWAEGGEGLWAVDNMGEMHIVDKPLTQHNLRTLQQELYWRGCQAYKLLENRSTGTIFSAGGDGVIGAWDYNGVLLYQIQSNKNIDIISISQYGNGGIILGERGGYLEVWEDNAPDGLSLLSVHHPHQEGIIGIQKVHDSELFISGSYDKSIKLIHPLQGDIYKDIQFGDAVYGITSSLVYPTISYGKYIIYIIYKYIYYIHIYTIYYILHIDAQHIDIATDHYNLIIQGIQNNPKLSEIYLSNVTKNSLSLMKEELISAISNLQIIESFKLSNIYIYIYREM